MAEQALIDELRDDPMGVGYSEMSHADVAKELNRVHRTVDRQSFTPAELFASMVESEYNDLPARGKTYIGLALQVDGAIPLTRTVRQQIGQAFPKGSQTRANLIALMQAVGSRAAELGLPNITPSIVAEAMKEV